MNTVGPYHNRQETYKYFSLPFCSGPKAQIEHHHETLGEDLQGIELEFSGLNINFRRKFAALIVFLLRFLFVTGMQCSRKCAENQLL